ncbi:MAG TPA: response regulator transcription factor [Chloroflexia bacterium]|nr:response regulator transcription factor [Chloroflexia bacterium]
MSDTQPNPPAKILVVDDEKTLRDMLEYNLRREGFSVLTAADGAQAVKLASEQRPDLIILDIMLPAMSGFDVVREVRRQATVPILLLSAREEEIDKVLGLELGADDYLTKPFSLRELLARVRAMLRRSAIIGVAQAQEGTVVPGRQPLALSERETPPVLSAGDLEIDLGRRSVTLAGSPVSLKPKEFDLLAFLASNPQHVFSREVLLDRVWGYDYVGGTRTVDVHVRWLRTKLEADPGEPQYIQTVYGVGYRFGQPVAARSRA